MNKLIIGILLFAIAFSLLFGCTQTTTDNTNTNNTTGANTIPTNNNNGSAQGAGNDTTIPQPPALPE